MNNEKNIVNRIAIVDDEPGMRYIITEYLSSVYANLTEYACGEDLMAALSCMPLEEYPDIVFLDQTIPGHLQGIEVLVKLKELLPSCEAIMLTAHGDAKRVVEAMKKGAFDYLIKPCSSDELLLTVEKALERRSLLMEVDSLRSRLEGRENLAKIMGSSQDMKKLHLNVERVASTNFSVLIQGESGTGKEVIAKAIHNMSDRKEGPFVAVDCGAIPATLMESELFGYEKGAFTGAERRKEGLFELANKGTLFLDEIANIPVDTQAKLLRALQERKIMHLGGKTEIEINIRVISATNLKLEEAIKKGTFRNDLYYRLNEFTVSIPALRKRKDDIVYLTNRFIQEANAELGKSVDQIDKIALEILIQYSWPGNVRELKNVVRRAVLLADHKINRDHILFDSDTFTGGSQGPGQEIAYQFGTLKEAKKKLESEMISRALNLCDGNKSEVARMLDIDYKNLLNKIKEYEID